MRAMEQASPDAEVIVMDPQVEDHDKKIPDSLEYASILVHLAAFGILGVLSRYGLQKLFGPNGAKITGDQSPLYPDLPPNLAGCFLMGWYLVFKDEICGKSNQLCVGLSTGYLGSLTTFTGWMQKMLEMASNGHCAAAVVGLSAGIILVGGAFLIGMDSAGGFKWLMKWLANTPKDALPVVKNHRNANLRVHVLVFVVMMLILCLLWGVSGVLAWHKLKLDKSNSQLWVACLIAPSGVWARWFLARLNGRGIGSKKFMQWLPLGTLLANVFAACIMAALGTVKEAVNVHWTRNVATGVQFGFLGCMSTVSTAVSETHSLRQSYHPWRAYVYVMMSIMLSLLLGIFIYSVPKWTKGYQLF